MSRPRSMPDFTALMDASAPIFEKRIHTRRALSPERRADQPRKRQSFSLATRLIMKADMPKNMAPVGSPRKLSQERKPEESNKGPDEPGNLFYAYALRSDYASPQPYMLTFATAAICTQWWAIVEREYPDATRPSPQFFVLKSEDMEHIQDDPKFFHLRHKWFYTSPDSHCAPSIIPLQNVNGVPISAPQQPLPVEDTPPPSVVDRLADSLERLASIAETNAEQINALSVAQSAGLQAMQEINESNSTQIKAIADSQIRLQSLVDQNASHYIALANTTFQSQEQVRDVLKTTNTQIQSLSKNQARFANTCDSMMRAIDSLSTSVEQMNLHVAMSDTASTQSAASTASLSAVAGRISPGPKKLNRRVKAVWYEYEAPRTGTPVGSPVGSPRKNVNFVDTPPRTPSIMKKVTV